MDIVKHVSSIPFFGDLPDEQIEDLCMIIADQVFNRGQIVFSEGDDGTGFYVVISGRVNILKLSPEGKEQSRHIFGPGDPFGEAAVFSGQHFPANAEAMEESRIFFFPRDSFAKLIEKNPSLALNMLAILSKRLRRFANLIDDLSLKEVPGRLAAHLLYLSGQTEGSEDLELKITKSQLASLLGTIPETLSRILGNMSKQGVIETDGRRIKILDREALEDLAESGGRL